MDINILNNRFFKNKFKNLFKKNITNDIIHLKRKEEVNNEL